jgi:hypothetical protein
LINSIQSTNNPFKKMNYQGCGSLPPKLANGTQHGASQQHPQQVNLGPP